MIVQYVNQQRKYPISSWKKLLTATLRPAFEQCPSAGLFRELQASPLVTVVFTGPRKMRQLNLAARQIDRTTDILSFPMLEFSRGELAGPLAQYDFDPAYLPRKIVPLGDLVLSLDKAFAQADEYDQSKEREVIFLALHGLLHLLGYDHQEPEEEKQMRQMQRLLLEENIDDR